MVDIDVVALDKSAACGAKVKFKSLNELFQCDLVSLGACHSVALVEPEFFYDAFWFNLDLYWYDVSAVCVELEVLPVAN